MNEEITRIKESIEGAFKPLRCVAQVWDYGAKLRFKVFDNNDQGIIERKSIVLRDLKSKEHLQGILDQAREEVRSKGFELEST